jgi:hypothetical protein
MRLGRHGILARALVAIGLIALSSSWAAISHASEILPPPAEFSMIIAVIDRPEMRSYQPYSGLQFGFRPTPPIPRGVRSTRPRIVMPKRVAPLIEYGTATPYSAQGYAYCANPPGDFEPRTGPYDSQPIERSQCP